MEVITPTNFRKDMFKILSEIANSNKALEVMFDSKVDANSGVIIISKREWQAIQEELHIQRTGTLDYVFSLMENEADGDF